VYAREGARGGELETEIGFWNCEKKEKKELAFLKKRRKKKY
jgi:hypothetical protein